VKTPREYKFGFGFGYKIWIFFPEIDSSLEKSGRFLEELVSLSLFVGI